MEIGEGFGGAYGRHMPVDVYEDGGVLTLVKQPAWLCHTNHWHWSVQEASAEWCTRWSKQLGVLWGS